MLNLATYENFQKFNSLKLTKDQTGKISQKLDPKIKQLFAADGHGINQVIFCKLWLADTLPVLIGWSYSAIYPRYDMYASLRFKQSYTWYTNSGDEDKGMIHDNLFWMSSNGMIEMKVLCEQFDPSKFDLKWTRLLLSDQMTLNNP